MRPLAGLALGALLLVPAGSTRAAELRIDLLLESGLAGPVEVALAIAGGDGGLLREASASAPGRIVVGDLPAGPWRVTAKAARTWSSPLIVADAGQGALRLWPEARLSGRVRVPQGVERPSALASRFHLPASGRDRGAGLSQTDSETVDCPIDEEGRFLCRLPAVDLDLRLRAAGFASRYFWGLALGREPERDLGSVELRPGASIVARVELPAGYALPSSSARLIPADQSPLGVGGKGSSDDLRELTVAPDRHGLLSFEGLGAGTYTLHVEHPGLAPATLSPIVTLPGAQTTIDEPIVLSPPMTLKLSIAPLFDPYDDDWRIEVVDGSGSPLRRSVAVVSGTATAGYFEVGALAPGAYDVRVLDSRGVRLAEVEAVVSGDSAVHAIRIDAIRVDGTVRFGDEPLVARLTFRDSSTIVMESDFEGRFSGYLPQAGSWDLEVEAVEPPVRRRERSREIAAEDGRARLEIAFPATRLTGVVVDETGRPRRSATVEVNDPSGTGRAVSTSSDVAGEFVFAGLPEGPATVRASAGQHLSSAAEAVDLREEVEPRLTLILRPNRMLRGRVVDPSGNPLPDVWLEIAPFTAGGTLDLSHAQAATTDRAGAFEVALPESSRSVHLAILAPGHGLRQQTVAVADLGDVVVEPGGGTIVVDLPAEVPWADPARPRPVLVDGAGHHLFLGLLAQWARLHGVAVDPAAGRLVIPSLAPGIYAVCWMGPEEMMRQRSSGQGCRSGELATGSELLLRLDELEPVEASTAGRS